MTYALRHNFMAEAVAEYKREIADKRYPAGWLTSLDAWSVMKREMTSQQRNDWFNAYCMGGEPYRHNP